MAISIEEKKRSIKEKRSRAIQQKLNLLWARDGCTSPQIESSKDEDDFNLNQLFGGSKSSQINWTQLGVEGLIRCYYDIIYLINGKKRNNPITNNSEVPNSIACIPNTYNRSDLTITAQQAMKGFAYKSGYFIGNAAGFEGLPESDSTTNQNAARGEYEITSSTFSHNRDKIGADYPENAQGLLLDKIQDAIEKIGDKSPLGPRIGTYVYGTAPPPYTSFISDSILGKRFSDVLPYLNIAATFTPGTPATESTPATPDVYTNGSYSYGNGTYDFVNNGWVLLSNNSLLDNINITVDDNDDLPESANPRHLYYILKTNKLVRWNGSLWAEITNGNIGITYYKPQVQTVQDLPLHPNTDGDIRLVTIPNKKYKWNGDEWNITLLGTPNKPSVQTVQDLPLHPNTDGDIRLVTTTNIEYRWDGNLWQEITGDNVTTQKSSVQTLQDLPLTGNINGDIRLVSETGDIYRWDFANYLTAAQDQASGVPKPPSYQHIYRDFYDATLDSDLSAIKTMLQDLWQFIEYTKVNYDNFFMNINVIPGRADNWQIQNNWQASIAPFIQIIDNYLLSKSTANRSDLDNFIITLKNDLPVLKIQLESIATTADAIFGSPTDAATLYGFRMILIKNLIDIQNGGSKVTLMSMAGSIEDAEKKIAQSEENFGIIGVILKDESSFSTQKYWDGGIVTPIIGGIETHLALDQRQFLDDDETIENENYFQMVPDGLIVAWEETAHATAYNVYKSNNYNPATQTGTWTPLIPSGQKFTNENIDINTGKVLSYFIDYDVDFEAEEMPYYKVQTFDTGKKLSNGYWWYGAKSDISLPMSASDFTSTPSSGVNIPGQSGSPGYGGSPGSPDTGVSPPRPDELPDYVFKYTTIKMGGEAADSPVNRIYRSDVAFDTIGSNLEVFVDGMIRLRGSGVNDYVLLDFTGIQFTNPINSNSKVTMIVYFGSGSGSSNGASGSWKAPVNSLDQRPTIGNKDGDVVLVLEDNSLYVWEESEKQWYEISNSSDALTHTDLVDMPDTNAVNADHDARYPRREEVDSLLSALQTQLSNLSYLIPDNAAPLSSVLEITNSPYYTGYLSGGGFNTFTTLVEYQQYNKIVTGNSFILESVNKNSEFSDADKGVLSLYINEIQVDVVDLASQFIESQRGQQQSWTPYMTPLGKIEITSIYPFNDYGQYQKCNFKIHIANNNLIPGENKIVLKHVIGQTTRSTQNFIFFWDSAPTEIFFNNFSLTEGLIGSQKYLSGVRYYSLNDKFNVEFAGQSLFRNTFIKGEQIIADMSELGIAPFSFDYTNPRTTSDGISAVIPNIYMAVVYKNLLSLNKSNIYSTNPTARFIGKQPHRTSSEYTKNWNNILINTYNYISDDKNEYFLDEKYRLLNNDHATIPANYQDQWDSKTKLNFGELAVFGGRLIYPNFNLSVGYLPVQTTNYSGFSGDRYYLRAFVDSGNPHNNGIFTINGDIFDDPYTKIMVKLPSQTGWLDLKKPYNEAEFKGINDDGALLEHTGNNFKWTSGGFSTALSGYMVILRVTMSNANAKPIEEISINW